MIGELRLHDSLAQDRSLLDELSDLDLAESQDSTRFAAPGAALLRRLGSSVSRGWAPVARRRLSGVAARLPVPVRNRLRRVFGLMRPDMRDIEREYQAWIDRYDRIDDQVRQAMLIDITQMASPPLISILM